tara:strand:- start:57228 stop:57770 length:543 start_codon:yes stop_codon:yes gene_type:complete
MTNPKVQHTILISALGEDKPSTIHLFSKAAKQCNCSIVTSKLSATGDSFGLLLEASGTWHAIAKLESTLEKLAKQQDISLQVKRAQTTKNKESKVPYYIQAISPDKVGILFALTYFFHKKAMNVDELNVEHFIAQKTGTPMTSISFHTYIPVKANLTSFRESFLLYCEEYNLDIVMEPLK